MLIIFCLSASAKPCGKKRRALRRRDQALVGNYLSRRTGQWALWRESFSWNSHDCSCTSLQGLLMQGWPKPTALPAAPLAAEPRKCCSGTEGFGFYSTTYIGLARLDGTRGACPPVVAFQAAKTAAWA